jgi:hypothetical protein
MAYTDNRALIYQYGQSIKKSLPGRFEREVLKETHKTQLAQLKTQHAKDIDSVKDAYIELQTQHGEDLKHQYVDALNYSMNKIHKNAANHTTVDKVVNGTITSLTKRKQKLGTTYTGDPLKIYAPSTTTLGALWQGAKNFYNHVATTASPMDEYAQALVSPISTPSQKKAGEAAKRAIMPPPSPPASPVQAAVNKAIEQTEGSGINVYDRTKAYENRQKSKAPVRRSARIAAKKKR